MAETRLDKLKETIDDKQAKIGDRIRALLLLLRSKHSEGENLQVDSIPTSLQLPESPDFNRPDPKPNYVINASTDVTKASSPLPNRTIKCHRRISLEEIEERRLKGLCLFCEESETPDHYLLHKNSGILMIDCDEDQSCDDEELVEMEVATESIETEHGTVKREANASMILANLEDESMPPFQVPVSDSKILRNVEKIEVEGDVERGQKVQSMEKIYSAHQVFGKMSRQETLGIKKKRKGFKSWRFKFKQRKQQRGKLRSTHQLIHRGNVMYKYLCSSAKVALMKKNKFSITWPTLKDDGFMEDDHVYQEGLPLWLLVRFKFWKFKFINRKLQKMMREHKFASHVKLMYDKGEPDELFIMAKAVSMRFLLGIVFGITENNAGQVQQAVFELIMTRVNLPEEYLVSMYLDGLQIDTQIHVRMCQPHSARQCLMLGRLYEKAHPKKPSISTETFAKSSNSTVTSKRLLPQPKDGDVKTNQQLSKVCDKPASSTARESLSQEERSDKRAKRLCFFCDEKFTPEHDWQHKKTQLYTKEVDAETKEVKDEIEPETDQEVLVMPHISVKAILGFSDYNNKRMKGTHDKRSSAGLTRVLVADGNKLGVLWLKTIEPITWGPKRLEMGFMTSKQKLLLRYLLSGPMKPLRKQLGNFSLTYISDFQHLNLEDKVLRRREI